MPGSRLILTIRRSSTLFSSGANNYSLRLCKVTSIVPLRLCALELTRYCNSWTKQHVSCTGAMGAAKMVLLAGLALLVYTGYQAMTCEQHAVGHARV